jgi:hypothetical protein
MQMPPDLTVLSEMNAFAQRRYEEGSGESNYDRCDRPDYITKT